MRVEDKEGGWKGVEEGLLVTESLGNRARHKGRNKGTDIDSNIEDRECLVTARVI